MTGAAAREARPAVGLRAMYRRVVAPKICDALERSTRQLAQPARLGAPGSYGHSSASPRPPGTDPGNLDPGNLDPDNLDSERIE